MIGVSIVLKGVSLHEYYDLMSKVLGAKPDVEDLPVTAHAHVAGSSEGDICVFQVWETKRDFQTFWEDQVEPARKKLGIDTKPQVNFFQVSDFMYRHMEEAPSVSSDSTEA